MRGRGWSWVTTRYKGIQSIDVSDDTELHTNSSDVVNHVVDHLIVQTGWRER